MLTARSHRRFGVAGRREVDRLNQPPAVPKSGLDPIPAHAKVTVAAKPMRVNAAALAELDLMLSLNDVEYRELAELASLMGTPMGSLAVDPVQEWLRSLEFALLKERAQKMAERDAQTKTSEES